MKLSGCFTLIDRARELGERIGTNKKGNRLSFATAKRLLKALLRDCCPGVLKVSGKNLGKSRRFRNPRGRHSLLLARWRQPGRADRFRTLS